MTRTQIETLLNLKGWRPAAYGIAWCGAYHDAIGLCFTRTDGSQNSSDDIEWAEGWSVNELPGRGDDILMQTWHRIRYRDLVRIFNEIERRSR